MKTYWKFEKDGAEFDAEFESAEAALLYADNAFQEECLIDGPAVGKSFYEDIILIEYTLDENYEPKEVRRTDGVIGYDHGLSDAVEHGTYHSGAGGVL